ncbi:MAG: hypothetical protein HAW67_00685 [Endozoicomonadaceae bacterium]|nr:hypothetical protein [Endozoicomonadaceae bacterium]
MIEQFTQEKFHRGLLLWSIGVAAFLYGFAVFELVLDQKIMFWQVVSGVLGLVCSLIYAFYHAKCFDFKKIRYLRGMDSVLVLIYCFLWGFIFWKVILLVNNVGASEYTIQGVVHEMKKTESTNLKEYRLIINTSGDNAESLVLEVTWPHYNGFKLGDDYKVSDWKKGLMKITYRSRWFDQMTVN